MQRASLQRTFTGNVRPLQHTVVAPVRASRAAVVVEARVAIRFQRYGRKKAPFYRLVAIDSRTRRDGKPIEYLAAVVCQHVRASSALQVGLTLVFLLHM